MYLAYTFADSYNKIIAITYVFENVYPFLNFESVYSFIRLRIFKQKEESLAFPGNRTRQGRQYNSDIITYVYIRKASRSCVNSYSYWRKDLLRDHLRDLVVKWLSGSSGQVDSFCFSTSASSDWFVSLCFLLFFQSVNSPL